MNPDDRTRPGAQPRSAASTTRRGAFWIVLFWLALGFALYAGFSHFEQARQAKRAPFTTGSGELVIPRPPDGHFRLPGTVNGHPVEFLVDTGASLVTVSARFAQQAGLSGGRSVTFHTANGPMPGRVLEDVAVSADPFAVGGVRVGVGLDTGQASTALLGQSFLSKFNIELNARQMVLRLR